MNALGPVSSSDLPARLADLLRRVNGLYAAVIDLNGESVTQAGDASLSSRVTPLALALLEGGGDVSGPTPFQNAYLLSPSRTIHAQRVDAKHVLCVVLPRANDV